MEFIDHNPNWIHEVFKELGIPLKDEGEATSEQLDIIVFLKSCNIATAELLLNSSFNISSFQKIRALKAYLAAFEKYLVLGLTTKDADSCQH